MTYNLSEAANHVASPAKLYSIDELIADDLLPREPGIYCWWFDDDLPVVPRDGTESRNGLSLLYVGIAPSRPPDPILKAVRDLRKRLRNHIAGRISTSTLRLSLASLLATGLDLDLFRKATGKRAMSKADERRLSDWMAEHARLAWVVNDAPWVVERELIKSGPRLPLNIKGSKDPFRYELKALRNSVPRHHISD